MNLQRTAIGALIGIVVLVVTIVGVIFFKVDPFFGGCIAALAVARLT